MNPISKYYARPQIFFDMENSKDFGAFLLGIMKSSGEYVPIFKRKNDDISDFLGWINGHQVVVFNAGYDINHLSDLSDELDFMWRDNKVSSKSRDYISELTVEYRGEKYVFEVYDLFGRFMVSLKTVGTLFGMKKGEVDFDDGISTEDFIRRIEEIKVYNKQDLDITRIAHYQGSKFYSDIGGVIYKNIFRMPVEFRFSRAVTIASIAFKQLLGFCALYDVINKNGGACLDSRKSKVHATRVSSNSKGINVDYQGKRFFYDRVREIKSAFFRGYRGGMVINEPCFVSSGDATTLDGVSFFDVNSLYPYAMTKIKIDPFTVSSALPDVCVYDPAYYGIARCLVHSCHLPLGLIVHDDETGRNRNRRWDGKPREMFLPFSEVRLLGEYGDQVEILEARGKRGVYPLHDYFIPLYSLRWSYKRQTNPFEVAVKLMMNSSYGKFGSRNYSTREKYHFKDMETLVTMLQLRDDITPETLNDILLLGSCRTFTEDEKSLEFSLFSRNGGHNFIVREEAMLVEDFYAAAEITGIARCIMQEYADNVYGLGGKIYAIDTDSIKTNLTKAMLEPMGIIDDTDLGKLKYEGTTSEFLSIRKKMYGYIGAMKYDEAKKREIQTHKPSMVGEPCIKAKGVKLFAVMGGIEDEAEIYRRMRHAYLNNLESFSVSQERRASIESGTQSETFTKMIKMVADGGIVNEIA